MFKPGATLTSDNATATLAAGLQAIAAGQATIDLSDVATVDSSAVAILLAWQRAAQQKGQALQFGVLPANLQSLVDLYGAASLLGAPTSASDRHH
ncbi:lipid asymmetry maintenance protein MlaB [Herbaspirillum sp. RV1423]|uniref:STAS domain-containing protein n=1 Tax=Herbaspirillum sp. RV1423 TaxID=1443993 RepID=UPI0004B01A90|nr:STAS domain-containing protein [Herbaspirillum sp. RV1423]